MPVSATLGAVPAGGPQPLARYLSAVAGGQQEAPALVAIPVQDAASAGIDAYLGAPAAEVIAAAEAGGKPGDVTPVMLNLGGGVIRALLIGLGDKSPAAMRTAGAALGRRVAAGRTAVIPATRHEPRPEEATAAFAEGVLLGSYRFSLAARDEPAGAPAQVQLLTDTPDDLQNVLARVTAVAGAVALARDLANMPSSRKSPAWLAGQAAAAADGTGVAVRVLGEAELAAGGFGGLLAVGGGSARPPALIELSYRPPGWRQHVVLAGKGITFDSGGLSLKPPDGMKTMKTDMAGGAVVIAVLTALARLGLPVRVTGLVAAAENMPSGSAVRPGDVITHFGGRTDEVLNSDAEGRLVLADALAYASATLDPDVMVDIATLTGAARVALGTSVAALYVSEDGLATELLAAGLASGDPLWRMPLVEDYRAGLESPVADICHIARGDGGRAGSIDAALFLREFTGGRPWAHLDIAGAARSASDDGERSKGATGFGVRVLLRWLADRCT